MTLQDMNDEANAFAMELLMPEHLLRADLQRIGGVDIEDDRTLNRLAKKYRVSMPVMAMRLMELSMLADAREAKPTLGTATGGARVPGETNAR